MGIFKWNRVACLMLVGLCSGGAVRAFADDDGKDKPSAKPAAGAKIETPAPLTERERWLLDRVEQLEKRVADLESSKSNPPAAPAADAADESQALAVGRGRRPDRAARASDVRLDLARLSIEPLDYVNLAVRVLAVLECFAGRGVV